VPELPEVETICRGLNQLTLRQKIMGEEVLLTRTLAYPLFVKEFSQGIEGTEIVSWQRRGKYLIAQLHKSSSQSAGWLGVHLRMTGQLLWLPQAQPLQKHTRLRLFFERDRELRFVDQRTFGKFWWVPPATTPEKIITGLQNLGPEPFSADFSKAYLRQKFLNSNRCIKTLLLDQSAIAGMGNIYADEALFKSGINPKAIAGHLSPEEIERLQQAIIEVLKTAIDNGGTTFSNFLNVTGVNGNYSGMAWVYGRAGESCRICSTPIAKIRLAGRSAHFCPQCQS
jgi:formamidopyrimidine-DNA glycosylase